jgi:hypothetical protein
VQARTFAAFLRAVAKGAQRDCYVIFPVTTHSKPEFDPFGRRQFITHSATAAVAAIAGTNLPAAQSGLPRRDSPVARENAREGARDWQLTRVRVDTPKGGTFREAIRSSVIEGYCSRQSVSAGEIIEFMVSTNPPARYQLEIFRTG